jgi:nucleoside-diphosphate-sugar epimerase
MKGDTVEVDGTAREWLYSKDAARAVHLASWNDLKEPGVFNVSEGVEHPGGDLAKAITDIFPDVVVKVAAPATTGPMASSMAVLDVRRTREVLGFATEFSIGEAFQDYYEWLTNAPSQVDRPG